MVFAALNPSYDLIPIADGDQTFDAELNRMQSDD
jgi:hypothetical protein